MGLSAEAAPNEATAMRRNILDAAASLLRRHSYEATTVRAIAEAVGIKAGSLYHYYPSKAAIAVAVVNEGVRVVRDAVVAALDALPADASPKVCLHAVTRAHLMSSLRNSDYTSASLRTFAHLPEGVREQCRANRREYEAIWDGIVNAADEAGLLRPGISHDVVRLMLLGAVNWAGEWYRPGRLSIDHISRDFAELIFGHPPGGFR